MTGSSGEQPKERPQNGSVRRNVLWLSGERVVRIAVQFVAGIAVARFLGPSRLGVLATVSSILVLLVALQRLGLDQVVMDALSRAERPPLEIVGSATRARLAAGAVGSVGALVTALILSGDLALGIGLLVIPILAMPLDTFRLERDLLLQSRSYVRARIGVATVAAGVQLLLVATGAPLAAFFLVIALAAAGEFVSGAAGTSWSDVTTAIRIRVDRKQLRRAAPLLLSALAISIYMRVDMLMLAAFSSEVQVGYYAVAVRISEIPYVLPTALATSMFADLARGRGRPLQSGPLRDALDVVAGLALLVILGVFVLAPWGVVALFGDDFAHSVPVLRIHVFAMLFVSWGVVRERWLVVESLEGHSMRAAVIGAVSNVLLNLVLIPAHGAVGAAWATTISYGVAVYGYSLAASPLRTLVPLMNQSLLRGPRALLRALSPSRGIS